jgi:DnaK suppressor protein
LGWPLLDVAQTRPFRLRLLISKRVGFRHFWFAPLESRPHVEPRLSPSIPAAPRFLFEVMNYFVSVRLCSSPKSPLDRHRIPDMNKNEDIAKALKARLSELTGRVAKIDGELRKPLPADSEERATYLENQDAFEGIGNSEIQEIHQIEQALKRIAEGTYGVCAQCGADIDPKRLKALPNATTCISCAA